MSDQAVGDAARATLREIAYDGHAVWLIIAARDPEPDSRPWPRPRAHRGPGP